MKITLDQPRTGGDNRTERPAESLFNGPGEEGTGVEVEAEQIIDVSPSEAWPWRINPSINTWQVQMRAVKGILVPFAMMDSQAAREAARAGADVAEAAGGVASYPFSDKYLPLSDRRDDEGDRIIDVNPDNFDERWAHFLTLYPDHFEKGLPTHGGTQVMSAVEASDMHFLGTAKEPGEFFSRPRGKRPKRARILHTDGLLKDAAKFRAYLAQATAVEDSTTSTVTPLGRHGEWDEAWIIAIYGEEGGEGHQAYEQYVDLAKDHPWIHPLYFENVMNGDEAAEDVALLAVPDAA
jgi:hypothetical protein